MRHVYKPSTPAEMYDRALHYAHDSRLPPDYPRPHPTADWPAENIRLLEEYCEWLRAGGASPAVIHNIYLPMAGHVLGLALKPHPQLDLDIDLGMLREATRAPARWLYSRAERSSFCPLVFALLAALTR